MRKTYEAWIDEQEQCITFGDLDNIQWHRTHGGLRPVAKLLHRIEADTPEQAHAGVCQAVCVNGSSFPCAAGDSGRWKSGNPGLGFPLFHGSQFFLAFVLIFPVWKSSFRFRLNFSSSAAGPRAAPAQLRGPVRRRPSSAGRSFRSRQRVLRNPVAEQNRETLQGGFPVLHRHGPLLGNMFQRQIQ
jgi:hypothetical protein